MPKVRRETHFQKRERQDQDAHFLEGQRRKKRDGGILHFLFYGTHTAGCIKFASRPLFGGGSPTCSPSFLQIVLWISPSSLPSMLKSPPPPPSSFLCAPPTFKRRPGKQTKARGRRVYSISSWKQEELPDGTLQISSIIPIINRNTSWSNCTWFFTLKRLFYVWHLNL